MPSLQSSVHVEEDEASIQLLDFQKEKLSLSRTISDEEVVFEQDCSEEFAKKPQEITSCSSTVSNSYTLVEEEGNNNKDQRLQQPQISDIKERKRQQAPATNLPLSPAAMSYDEVVKRRRQELANNQAQVNEHKKAAALKLEEDQNSNQQVNGMNNEKGQERKKPAATEERQIGTSPKASANIPAKQASLKDETKTAAEREAEARKNQQELILESLAGDKESQEKFLRLQRKMAAVASPPKAATSPPRESPPVAQKPSPLIPPEIQQQLTQAVSQSPDRTKVVAQMPTPAPQLKEPPPQQLTQPPQQPPLTKNPAPQLKKSPPPQQPLTNNPAPQPPPPPPQQQQQQRVEVPQRPLININNDSSESLKQPPPPATPPNAAAFASPSVAAASSHARLQGNVPLSASASDASSNNKNINSSVRGQPTGLSRQGGSHHVQQHGLSRQRGAHQLSQMPVLPVQDTAERRDSFAASSISTNFTQPHQVPDSQLMAMMGGGRNNNNNNIKRRGLGGRSVGRHSNQGPPVVVTVGGPPGALRNFMSNNNKGLRPVSPETIRKAEKLNMERQQRNLKKKQQQEQQRRMQMQMQLQRQSLVFPQQQQQLQPQQKGNVQQQMALQQQPQPAPTQQPSLQSESALERIQQPVQQQKVHSGDEAIEEDPGDDKEASVAHLKEGDELDASMDLEDLANDSIMDLANDSIKNGQSFALASKHLLNSKRPSDPRMDVDLPSGSQRQKRQSVMMQKDMSQMAIEDPAAFNRIVSEPGGALPAANPAAALRDKRRSMTRDRSSQVMLDTATLQQSTRHTGISSLTDDHPDVKAAVANATKRSPKWSSGRTTFPGNVRPGQVSNDTVSLDNAVSVHSSVGFASARDLLGFSGHLKVAPESGFPRSTSGGNYNPQLQPHIEQISVLSGGNNSTRSLDASSVVNPPTRDQVRSRHTRPSMLSVGNGSVSNLDASSIVNPPSRDEVRSRHTPRASIIVPDGASVASSLVSAGARRRTSIMRPAPQNAVAAVSSRVANGNQPGVRRTSRTSVASAGLSVGAAARRRSKQTNIPTQKRSTEDLAKAYVLLKQKEEKQKNTILTDQNDLIMEMAIKQSMEEHQMKVRAQQEPHFYREAEAQRTVSKPQAEEELDPALLKAILESENSQPAPLKKADGPDEATLMAILQSQNDVQSEPLARVDSDRELKIALEVSRVETIENDKKRRANQLMRELGEGLSELPTETKVPAAPRETDAEAAGTLEVAMRLSRQEYEHETSKRAGARGTGATRIGPTSPRASHSERDSVLEYSVSTQHDGTVQGFSRSGRMAALSVVGSTPSLVMPPLEDDHSTGLGPSRPRVPATDPDEALALAMARSKMDVGEGAGNATTPDLSQEESMAYALELSRRTPGAHESTLGTQSSTAPTRTMPEPSTQYQTPTSTSDRFHQPYPPTSAAQPYNALPYPPPYQYPYHQAYCPQPYPPPRYPPYPPAYQQPYPPPFQQPYPPPYPPPYQLPYPPQPYAHPHAPQPHYYPPPPPPFSAPMISAPPTYSYTVPADEDDEAFRMALAISRGDAQAAGSKPSHRIATTTSSFEDDESLALALELSRNCN